jgi:hypothetical protein
MPREIQTIFEQQTDGGKIGVLGIDQDTRLYWNGQLIVTEQKVKLSWWVNVSVIIGGLSTAAIAVFTALLYFKSP